MEYEVARNVGLEGDEDSGELIGVLFLEPPDEGVIGLLVLLVPLLHQLGHPLVVLLPLLLLHAEERLRSPLQNPLPQLLLPILNLLFDFF
jgi:hypothetical protein